jgi:hypothetical protein
MEEPEPACESLHWRCALQMDTRRPQFREDGLLRRHLYTVDVGGADRQTAHLLPLRLIVRRQESESRTLGPVFHALYVEWFRNAGCR